MMKKNGRNNIFDFLAPQNNYFLTGSARGGLEALIELIWVNSKIAVMMPVFIAEGVIAPFKKKNISIVFYKIKRDLSPDLDDVMEKISKNCDIKCIIALHYFGVPVNLNPLKKICEKNDILLFEDCVHALFSKDSENNYLGTVGDVAFFSFPKILPVPDGAIFIVNQPRLQALIKNIRLRRSIAGFLMVRIHLLYLLMKKYEVNLKYSLFYKIMNANLKFVYGLYYYILQRIRNPIQISRKTIDILKNIDYDKLIKSRVKNTKDIYSVMESMKCSLLIKEYNENWLLTGVPILSLNRDEIVKSLRINNIDCLTYLNKWCYMPIDEREKYCFEADLINTHFLMPIHEDDSEYGEVLRHVIY